MQNSSFLIQNSSFAVQNSSFLIQNSPINERNTCTLSDMFQELKVAEDCLCSYCRGRIRSTRRAGRAGTGCSRRAAKTNIFDRKSNISLVQCPNSSIENQDLYRRGHDVLVDVSCSTEEVLRRSGRAQAISQIDPICCALYSGAR